MATDPMVVYGSGQCRECGCNLAVIDIESTLLELDDDGSPRSEDTIIRVTGKCPHCGREYKMFRDGLNYVHDNSSVRLQKQFDYITHCRKVAESMDRLKAREDNPFFLPLEKMK